MLPYPPHSVPANSRDGYRIEQAGFTPGQRVRVVVEHGRMIITAD
ncbi:SymE family type I addiction module toxin [Ralstonia solanacearum]|nr:SymE family type I addiction module toxin [Ralstonia solanacearum]